MAQPVSNVRIIRQFETDVRVSPGICRYTTIVGALLNLGIAGDQHRSETYTCQLGPVLKAEEYLGASCLPSIGRLEPTTLESAQCLLESWDADWNEASGQVELRVKVAGTGGAAKVHILFSVTILATA